MHEYELIYIRRAGPAGEQAKKVDARIIKAFEKHGGIMLRDKELGEKTLAYLIQKEQKGNYRQLNFCGPSDLVAEIESQLRIAPEVLRFLTVRLARNVDPDQKKTEYAKAETASKSESPSAEA